MEKNCQTYCQPTIFEKTAALSCRAFLLFAILLFTGNIAFAQATNITGAIKGTDNMPLSGVTVKLKGAQASAISDQNGNFTITVPGPTAVLVLTYVNYERQEVSVGKQKTINIILKPLNNSLDEVVVIGYGTVKRRDATTAQAGVNMADFEKAPVKSFDDALAGRIAGVTVSGNDGQPGSVNNIVIRGAGSITQDVGPLYVIDGFPLESSDANSISPSDIESIEVLKDAAATAIYGSRGSNGVIIITTKRGRNQAPTITYNGYYGNQHNPKDIKLMDTYEFVKYQLEYFPTTAVTQYLTTPGLTLEDYRSKPTTKLADYYIKEGYSQNNDLSIRGGNENTQYSISGNVFYQKGMLTNTGFRRYQGRISLDQKINNKLKVGLNVNYSSSKSYGGIVGGQQNASYLSSLYNVWGWRPISGVGGAAEFDVNNDVQDLGGDNTRYNPIINAQNQLLNNFVNNMTANAYVQYAITPNLTFKATGGIVDLINENNVFNNSKTQFGNPLVSGRGVNGSITNIKQSVFLNENTLTYNKVFQKIHSINIVAGFSETGVSNKSNNLYAQMLPNESEGLDGLEEAASGQQTVNRSSTRNALVSYYTRLNYGFKSKYLFSATFRADGSSKFMPQNRWGYFPVGSFAWRASGEKFMKNIKFITDLKLRASYGLTGNNRVPDFATLPQLSFPLSIGYDYNNNSVQGAAVSSFGNPDLKWESAAQGNIGIDVSMFKNRIQLTVDAYDKTTRDLLLNAQIPSTTGLQNSFINVGKIQNRGLEFSLNTINIKNKNFMWSSNFNISFNSNKVLALSNGASQLFTTLNWDLNYGTNPAYIAQVGQPVSQMYGLIFDGIYQYTDFDKLPNGKYLLKPDRPTNGGTRSSILPGDIRYKDINGDNVVNANDFTVIGNSLPLHTGGFSNNFSYKGFDLNVLLQWSYGNSIMNANRLVFEGNGKHVANLNQWASYEDRWQPDNPTNLLPRAGGEGLYYYSSRVVEDGSYLRLKTVSLGYNLPSKWISKAKIKTMRVYLSAQNLATWTSYTGPDPEVSARHSTLTQGFDYAAYPHARLMTFGFNVSF